MGTLSLERTQRLLWLGRYMARSVTTLKFILATYDRALDSVEGNWKGQLEELGFDNDNDDPWEFFHECLFSRTLPSSVYCSLSAACGNAMVLRDVVGTESAAYVQMAFNELELAEVSDAPLLDLQQVIDMIMAFKGSCDDFITNDAARNIVKCGISIERMDLYARLNYRLDDVRRETQKLATRIDRTGLSYDRQAFKQLIDQVFSPRFPTEITYEELGDLLGLIAQVFS